MKTKNNAKIQIHTRNRSRQHRHRIRNRQRNIGSFDVKEIDEPAWYQSWEESERGWGQRPDGYSLHLTEQDAKDYAKGYMDEQKRFFRVNYHVRQLGESVPQEYNRPAGHPYKVILTDKTMTKLQESGTIRIYAHEPTEQSEIPKPLNETEKSGWVTP